MPKKLMSLFILSSVLLLSPLSAAEKQVRVIADRAPIYAENNIYSYKIEIVKKGTILTVFESGQPMKEWFYVRFHSQRWKSVVTGFIQASMIEEITDKPKEEPREEKITAPQREQIREDVQPKVEQVTVTETVGISLTPPSTSYALPEVKIEEEPRVFISIETKPVATESSQKQAKTVSDITKKTPEKTSIQPESKVKTEEAAKEEEPAEKKPEQKQVVPQIATERPPRPKKPKLPSELSLLTMSVGYGPSLGSGLGGFVQLNTKMGFSLHLGAGYYPTSYFYSEYDWVKNRILYSAGIKYYLPFKTNTIRTYLDLQYGGVSVEAVRIITGIWYYQYVYEDIQKTLLGPSILAGIELKLGSIGLSGAIGFSYNTTEWDYWERDYFLTADVGLLIYLW